MHHVSLRGVQMDQQNFLEKLMTFVERDAGKQLMENDDDFHVEAVKVCCFTGAEVHKRERFIKNIAHLYFVGRAEGRVTYSRLERLKVCGWLKITLKSTFGRCLVLLTFAAN